MFRPPARGPGGRRGWGDTLVLGLGGFFDRLTGVDRQSINVRRTVRDLLVRIGQVYQLEDRQALLRPHAREAALSALAAGKVPRVHLIEYHAVCRFELLTDLGLLLKEDPRQPTTSTEERQLTRQSWRWLTTSALEQAAAVLAPFLGDAEAFLTRHWIEFCAAAYSLTLRRLDPFVDQREVALLLDTALPDARRQLGAIQLHTWAVLTCLEALRQGQRLELGDVYDLFDAMRDDPEATRVFRRGGSDTFLGRTGSVLSRGLAHFLAGHPVRPHGGR
jgi:hypothetical protein